MDEDNDEHGQEEADHTDTHGDGRTEMDEQDVEDDTIAPLPPLSSRCTSSAGYLRVSTAMSTKSKPNANTTPPTRASVTAAKGKAEAWPPEVKTPLRRSSRLSTVSFSPDHNEAVSPTKKGPERASSKASVTRSGRYVRGDECK